MIQSHRKLKRRMVIAALGATSTALAGVVGVAPALAGPTATAAPFLRMLSHRPMAAPPTTAQCEAAIGIACYQPSQYQAAYDLGPLYANKTEGQGQTIAVVDSFGSPDIASQLRIFDTAFGLPAPPSLKIIQPAGVVPPFDPLNSVMVGWSQETSLDVEYAHTIAPKANILLVETPVAETEGVVGFPEIVAAENYVVNNHLAQVITQSFGATEETFPNAQSLLSLRSAFVNAANNGVTVLGASGDGGATDNQANGTSFYLRPVNSWPSADPLVTSVGGTQMHLTATGTHTQPDTVWNDTNLLSSPAAGGGNPSSIFARPAYQNSVASVVGASRGTPDISMSAAVDGGALVYLGANESGGSGAGYYVIGGTSEASPLFSGIVALSAQTAGHGLGLINPALYKLQTRHAAGVVDVTAGTNTVTFTQGGGLHTVNGHDAVAGYDLASGMGTVDGAAFVPELAAATG